MKRQLITTDDGSYTLFVPELNEHYHSTQGARMESAHVFIDAGLRHTWRQRGEKPLQILEIGFGTGLNALLTWGACDAEKIGCRYETIEKYPLSEDEANTLNYAPAENMHALHACEWNSDVMLSEYFILCKISGDLLGYQPTQKFDLIFFDAFAPGIQPELWTEDIFKKLYACQNNNGILVTYSSKGTVKQALRNVGYHVERLSGAGGKRHMVRATKPM